MKYLKIVMVVCFCSWVVDSKQQTKEGCSAKKDPIFQYHNGYSERDNESMVTKRCDWQIFKRWWFIIYWALRLNNVPDTVFFDKMITKWSILDIHNVRVSISYKKGSLLIQLVKMGKAWWVSGKLVRIEMEFEAKQWVSANIF